jgi:ABC-2 type transport system ATP-binding protein
VVTIEFTQPTNKEKLQLISNVKKVSEIGKNRYQLSAAANKDIRQEIFRFAVENNLTLIEMHKELLSIEDVFQQLTQA